MTATKFEQIKNSIKEATKKSTMAEGKKQSIEEKLLKDFGIEGNIEEEVNKRLEKVKNTIEKDKKEKDKLLEELDSCAEWDEIE